MVGEGRPSRLRYVPTERRGCSASAEHDGRCDIHKTGDDAHGLITLRQLLDHAAEHGYGVPAFNINNMEQVPRHHGGGDGRPTRR